MTKAAISIPRNLLEQFDCIVRGVIESIAKLQQDFREIIPLTMLLPVNNTEKFRLELLILPRVQMPEL
jgi:metal-responsive CopG/Arc/MetJ family transcriptional regulator